jgi:hypothetical protein
MILMIPLTIPESLADHRLQFHELFQVRDERYRAMATWASARSDVTGDPRGRFSGSSPEKQRRYLSFRWYAAERARDFAAARAVAHATGSPLLV